MLSDLFPAPHPIGAGAAPPTQPSSHSFAPAGLPQPPRPPLLLARPSLAPSGPSGPSVLSSNVDKIAGKLAASVFLSRHAASYSKQQPPPRTARGVTNGTLSGHERAPHAAAAQSGGAHLAAAARALRQQQTAAATNGATRTPTANASTPTVSASSATTDLPLPLPAGVYQLQSAPGASAGASSTSAAPKLFHVLKFVSSALPTFTATNLRLTRPATAARRHGRPPPPAGRKKGKRGNAAEEKQSEASEETKQQQQQPQQAVGGETAPLSLSDGSTSAASSPTVSTSSEWRLDDIKARRTYTGQAELSGAVAGASAGAVDAGSSYVLLYSRDASKQPFTVHACDFVVLREQAHYQVLSLEEAEQRMKQRAKRFDKRMNALPTLARLEGERQMEQRMQDAAASDTAAGGGGGGGGAGGGGEGGLPGATRDDGQQGVQIRRKVAVGVAAEDDESAGRDEAGAAAGGDDDDDDPFDSAAGAGRGRSRKNAKALSRDKEAGIDYRDEFDDDDETHEDKSALADGNEHDEDEHVNVDEPTIESEDEEENEGAKKRTEELIKKADEEQIKQQQQSTSSGGASSNKKKAMDSNVDSDLDSADEGKEDAEGQSSDSSDDSGDDGDQMSDIDDSELELSSDEDESDGQKLGSKDNRGQSGAQLAALSTTNSPTLPRTANGSLPSLTQPDVMSAVPAGMLHPSDVRDKKRGRAESAAAVADGAQTGGAETASKKVKADSGGVSTVSSGIHTAPTLSSLPGGGAELDDALVRSAFISQPRATIQELTKRLTKATHPQPIDKARLIAILKRVCELDPNTKQLTLKPPVAVAAAAAATTSTLVGSHTEIASVDGFGSETSQNEPQSR